MNISGAEHTHNSPFDVTQCREITEENFAIKNDEIEKVYRCSNVYKHISFPLHKSETIKLNTWARFFSTCARAYFACFVVWERIFIQLKCDTRHRMACCVWLARASWNSFRFAGQIFRFSGRFVRHGNFFLIGRNWMDGMLSKVGGSRTHFSR